MRSFIALSLIILNLTLVLTGCSGHDGGAPTYMPENYSNLEKELINATFYCKDESKCPNNVGLIFINQNGNHYNPTIAQCTGFLIDKDIVATNSHCIPRYLKAPNTSCFKNISIRFLNDNSTEEIFNCLEILDYSSVNIFQPDYAFFRINKTNIQPLPINKDGLRDSESIYIAKVSPFSNRERGGVLEMDNCELKLGSLLNPQSTNRWSKTAIGMGCQSTGGNSGSPVFNQNGLVIGILQGRVGDGYRRIIEHSFRQFGISMPLILPSHILFTSFSCVSDPVSAFYNHEKCTHAKSVRLSDCIDFRKESNQSNLEKVIKKWQDELPGIFVYRIVSKENSLTTRSEPICVKPKNKYSSYDDFVNKEGIIGFRKDKIDLVYPNSISINAKLSTNSSFQLKSDIDFNEERRSNLNIKLVKDGNQWVGTTSSISSDNRIINFFAREIPITIPECTDEQLSSNFSYNVIELSDGNYVNSDEYALTQNQTERALCEN